MIRQVWNSWLTNKPKGRVSVNRREEKELSIIVLEHARHCLRHYSIEDPTNQYIDLMLAPGMIEEAVEMLEGKGIRARGSLIDYPIVKRKQKKLRKARF
ncbi:MAG: hypothetical protein ABJF04_16170 [Reichenbachiella sp.]|uniref:hypothetical protein n=1 Tax=Reichenbachiella sp. TaxID=2184521 RepID=UPI0032660E89